jgi:uncharacterized protein (DUF1778 family)
VALLFSWRLIDSMQFQYCHCLLGWHTDRQRGIMARCGILPHLLDFCLLGIDLMPTITKAAARLNFRLRPDLKQVIEAAAAQLGQSVSDFAVATLVREARQVVHEQSRTQPSDRDRDIFLTALDRTDLKPNKKLGAAAQNYKRQVK